MPQGAFTGFRRKLEQASRHLRARMGDRLPILRASSVSSDNGVITDADVAGDTSQNVTTMTRFDDQLTEEESDDNEEGTPQAKQQRQTNGEVNVGFRGGSATSNSEPPLQYEELMSGSVPCPSCRGSGRIPNEMERQLVALIPVSDKRLKPRRTTLWVLLAVGLCVLGAGVVLFFILPRSLDVTGTNDGVHVVSVKVFKRELLEQSWLEIKFKNHVFVTNHNFYPVRITNATASVINRFQPWRTDVIGKGENATGVMIGTKVENELVNLNYTVTIKDPGIVVYCQSTFSRFEALFVLMQFDVTVTFEYMGRREQDTVNTIQQVRFITLISVFSISEAQIAKPKPKLSSGLLCSVGELQ